MCLPDTFHINQRNLKDSTACLLSTGLKKRGFGEFIYGIDAVTEAFEKFNICFDFFFKNATKMAA